MFVIFINIISVWVVFDFLIKIIVYSFWCVVIVVCGVVDCVCIFIDKLDWKWSDIIKSIFNWLGYLLSEGL